jgi:hypothetical protein
MLTNKQVNHLHEERNRLMRFCQELREMAAVDDEYFWMLCIVAANDLHRGALGIDKIILEGSAEK